jgi:hypothetical protein
MERLGRHRPVALSHKDVRGPPLFALQTPERAPFPHRAVRCDFAFAALARSLEADLELITPSRSFHKGIRGAFSVSRPLPTQPDDRAEFKVATL